MSLHRTLIRAARSPVVAVIVLLGTGAAAWNAWEQPSATVVGEVRVVLLPPDHALPNALAETPSAPTTTSASAASARRTGRGLLFDIDPPSCFRCADSDVTACLPVAPVAPRG